MNSEVAASFRITGRDLDPDAVSQVTGVSPSTTWRMGEPVGTASRVVRRENGWVINSGLSSSEDVNAHVHSLLQVLRRSWNEFVEFGKAYDAEFSCVISSFAGDRPPIYFDKETVHQAAELNAELDVDLYVFNENGSEAVVMEVKSTKPKRRKFNL